MRSLLSVDQLDATQVAGLFKLAKSFAPAVKNERVIPLLQGMTVVNLFFENSTRTRSSFDLATRRLGGTVLNFAVSESSVKKGETLVDTAKNIVAMGANCLVVRHASAGGPAFLSQNIEIPVINAGDGFHEHPTQALLDAFTIEQEIGALRGKKVLILGDIAHSRVARSNIKLLKKLGATVSVCGPPTLMPPASARLSVKQSYRPEEFLPSADVVMVLRIQLERQNKMQIPSLAEYSRFWGINRARAALMKKNAIILHPGPVNRGVELDPDVADGPSSRILDQVFNGVLIRMAVLATLCGRAK